MPCKYFYNGKFYTEEELAQLPEFKLPFALEQMNRNFIINNTGENTEHQINYFPGVFNNEENAEAGAFAKFLQFKKSQALEYQKRLNRIEIEKKKRAITQERLLQLNKLERELKLQLEGNYELGIKGLKQEIADLTKDATIESVGYYIEKDLQRLENLVKSNDVDDLREAQRIVDFYDLAGTFNRNRENPFFTQEEIFLTDENDNITSEYRLGDEILAKFRGWRDRALLSQNIIDKRKEEVTINSINNDPTVKNTYNDKKFTFKEIVNSEEGLKDTDWISMWTMDITNGLFSTNGIIPQAMFSYLTSSFEKKLAWAREIEERVDKINPSVQKELIKLGYSLRGAGILGIKGASYQLFKEITKEGNETGGLVQRFTKEYFDAESSVKNKFHEKFGAALGVTIDYATRARLLNKAFEDYKRWRRINNIILDVSKVPELLTTSTPEAEAYKTYLIGVLGEKGYKEQVEKQQRLLEKYESEKQSMIETLLIMEGKTDFADLSDKAKSDLSYWETNHNPKTGIEDYNTITGIFFGDRKVNNFMDYNVFIPRKNQVTIKANQNTNQYQFIDNSSLTGFYNSDFEKIESNPILSEFYDIIKEVCDTTRENLPYELQTKMAVNTVPALAKTSTEIIADKNTGILSSLFLAFKNLSERIRVGFGVIKQSEVSYATIDPVTGKANYKVNDQFIQGNTRAVKERMTIEKHKFMQAYGKGLTNIRRHTVVSLNDMSDSSLVLLAQYINVDISLEAIKNKNLKAIRDVTGENVEIGKYIRDFSLHSVVQSQSFDLGKIGKYYSNMIMSYAARQEALPILEIMKQHYENIQKPKTTNLGKGIYNANDEKFMKDGFRTNANKQMDDWFERVALDNYGTKHLGPHGIEGANSKRVLKIDTRLAQIDNMLATNPNRPDRDSLLAEKERLLIKKVIPNTYGKSIYTAEEKKKIVEIEMLLSTELDPAKRAELIEIREKMGKVRTATALFDNLWAWIRTLRLGYNVSSATINFLEGVTSNMIMGSTGEYFDPKELHYGYNVAKHSFLKNVTFGLAESGLAKKNRSLMDKFNVIMDSKNELQKSSVRTYANKLSWLNPHELNQRVEYVNQSPIMIAMLRTQKIKSKSGVESSIWDAMTKEGHLKDEFKTEKNIENWEKLSGDDYLVFKQKLHKAIVVAHGNYHDLRGMMIKSNSGGKALMMFKTWIPMQFYWRFATEQDDIQSGTVGYRGRYWSYGKGSAATHLGAVGLAAFGPLGAIAGGVLGYAAGRFFGTDSGVGLIKETLETNKQLFKKLLGMPVNLLAGRQIIGTNNAFNDWVGKGDFTEKDAKAMRGNMADLALQLAWLALILAAKAIFWDDDEEKKAKIAAAKAISEEEAKRVEAELAKRRVIHNISVNKLMQLSSQAGQYVNPVDTYKSTIGSNGVIQYLVDVGKELTAVSEALHGRDIIQSGLNAGESRLRNQTYKTFMPGIFKDNYFGFETQAEKVFEESPFHPYFKSVETVDREDNKRDRAERRLELEEQGLSDKEVRDILDAELPTPTKLRKLGMTREEYEETQQNQ